MKRIGWIGILAFVVLANLVAGGWWLSDRRGSADGSADVIAASGRIENETVRVAAAVGGRIERLLVRDGEVVDPGQVLAELDRRSLEAARAAAHATVAAAEASVDIATRRTEAVESQLDLARKEAARYRRLYERDAGPRQAAEQAEAVVSQLESERRAAEALIEQARRQVDAARAQLSSLMVQLDETVVRAPVRGAVEETFLEAGEMAIPAAPILTIRPAGDATLVVYLPLPAASRVRVGSEARVFPEEGSARYIAGTVSHVASEAEFTPRDIHMPDERATLVFRVEIRIPDPDGSIKDGFPVDALVRLDASAAWPTKRPW